MAHRDLLMHVTGVCDHVNRAGISVSKSKEAGETYKGVVMPDVPEGLVRM